MGREISARQVRPTIVLFAALALGGCYVATANLPPPAPPSGPPPTAKVPDKELFKQARQALLANLKDPDSAKFGEKFERYKRATRLGEPYEVVCGKVNAKNGFGGYGGMKTFAWIVSDTTVTVGDLGYSWSTSLPVPRVSMEGNDVGDEYGLNIIKLCSSKPLDSA